MSHAWPALFMTIRLATVSLLVAAPIHTSVASWAGEAESEHGSVPPSLSTLQRGTPGPMDSPPLPDPTARMLREPPTISGEIQVGDQTLIPYLGAGFGGGYATEQDRMLSQDPTLQQKSILGNTTGGYLPNEFHMGLRIPF
ncbi:MAG: hypothetical protein AB7G48_06330 [Nitrospiraceae bacterium]